jgi:CBS domain-containing protein
MTPNPVSIPETATVHEAMALLTDKGFSAAPVIDEAGRPVGVISRTDILIHERERIESQQGTPEVDLAPTHHGHRPPEGFQIQSVDTTLVRAIMTPVVFCVAPETSACSVIAQMLFLKVHRLFVVDDLGVLVGVISSADVLRALHGERSGTCFPRGEK